MTIKNKKVKLVRNRKNYSIMWLPGADTGKKMNLLKISRFPDFSQCFPDFHNVPPIFNNVSPIFQGLQVRTLW